MIVRVSVETPTKGLPSRTSVPPVARATSAGVKGAAFGGIGVAMKGRC